jgi:hypothetical protein
MPFVTIGIIMEVKTTLPTSWASYVGILQMGVSDMAFLFCNFVWITIRVLCDICVWQSTCPSRISTLALECVNVGVMGVEPFHDKASHPLLWAGSPVASAEITVSGTHNSLNYCVIFVVYTRITNVAAGHIMQPGGMHEAHGPQVGSLRRL